MSDCAIIMYHYVRDLDASRFPGLKALSLKNFKKQLDYLQKEYSLVSAENIRACLQEKGSLPDKACHLTFDDGYLEHYTEVFPELVKRGIQGSFYPPVCALKRDRLLPVNKIHLILAAAGDKAVKDLVAELKIKYEALHKEGVQLPPWGEMWLSLAKEGRFDPKEVIFFKRFLQHALSEPIRNILLDALFSHYVNTDEAILAKEVYVSADMLRVMAKNGMHIGAHGLNHVWLDKIGQEKQAIELAASLEMLNDIYEYKDHFWSIAYPFGGWNESLHELCAKKNCSFGLTTEARIAKVNMENALTLARLDTNDLKYDKSLINRK